ncbi:MAG: 2,3-bisphosphoglycerate-independent phosphoglycerate mutase [Patescibacteria group bacterium]
MQEKKKKIALIVLDGWGFREDTMHNAIAEAETPFFDSLWQNYPHSFLDASEENVGLPKGQIGNSEVGHMTIGAGRVIDTDLVRITKAMQQGEFINNLAFKKVFDHVKKNNSTLHLLGLVSPGGIHSHEAHLYGILRAAKEYGVKNVVIHAFTDGRDTPPQSAVESLKELENLCEELGLGFIATVSGRFYAMDRDKNWNRTEKVKDVIFEGKGIMKTGKASDVVSELYKSGVMDEHIEPMVFWEPSSLLGARLPKIHKLEKNDGVLFFNFRSDRARMLSKYIEEVKEEKNICFVTLTEYDKNLKADVAFASQNIENTLAGEVSKAGFHQAHIAETEKYPHATYFLNGGKQEPYKNEDDILIESRKDVPTHDLAPEMRAREITDAAIASIPNNDFIFINFANADMVGHTANKPAIITAVETVDRELGRFIEAFTALGGIAFITADHGNAEVNIDPITGEKHTAHTLSKVPAILTDKNFKLKNGTLADITPTILSLYSLPVPKSMTGNVLIS